LTPSGKKRALITGLHGFTGHYVAAELEQAGYEIFGIDAYAPEGDSRCRRVDLADPEGLGRVIAEIKPHVVVHLAAIAFVGHGDANAFYQVNLMGTRNLLAALVEHAPQVGSVLLASSANIYGNAEGGVLGEETPPSPANDYAVSKLAMEHMARLWLDRLPIFIVRPFNYTGIGQSADFLIPKIIEHFKAQAAHIELGNLDVWREFNDVRSIAITYRKLLDLAPVGQTLNVCSGKMHSLREVIACAEQISGHSLEVRVNPAFVRANEVTRLCGDGSRLNALLGKRDLFALEDTLSWMLKANC
jgi:nucleoside-diphosphate-sugar epimerase